MFETLASDNDNITINVPIVYIPRDEVILMRATSISRAIRMDGP